jgi:hypothetical protein
MCDNLTAQHNILQGLPTYLLVTDYGSNDTAGRHGT